MRKNITIAIATIFQNGGDATRALEIAKIIREYKPENCDLRIVFLTRGSLYEEKVIHSGFELYRATPQLEGIRYQDDFETKFGELIGNEALAYDILQGEIKAYKEIDPDLIIYGFWPIGSIARRLAIPNVKSIAFLPLPLTEVFLTESLTFPDELSLSRLPVKFQRWIMNCIPHSLKKKNPALKHSLIRKAAERSGWSGSPLINVFEMLKSDLFLVNDLPIFYQTERYDSNVIFTGPVYAQEKQEEIKDKEILKILDNTNTRKKFFCTLGTSGSKQELLEIVKMFNSPWGMKCSGIILSPPSICPLEESRGLLNNENIYVTDKFVPAKAISKRVDLVICHGGQGTLQTAITSAIPLIGVATQPEQKINLEHLEAFGSAIQIPMRKWNCKTLEKKSKKVLKHYPRYKQNAEILCRQYNETNAKKIIGEQIWKEIEVTRK
ncbi:MAG: glycosyltransferase [Porphyromonas sp.]|nr:glycosyltransferase [Porphyromonas sp.]